MNEKHVGALGCEQRVLVIGHVEWLASACSLRCFHYSLSVPLNAMGREILSPCPS